MTIGSAIGPATVLHRLALGVECLDALDDRAVRSAVRVGRQVAANAGRPVDPTWPCIDLEPAGAARFKLRHNRPLPKQIVVRIDDPTRRYSPRRFAVDLRPLADLDGAAGKAFVPVASRTLRSWLWPGAAYAMPSGTTLVRGRVTNGSVPVRWARLKAIGPSNVVAGRAHCDDRGEFVLVISESGQNPLQATIPVHVIVSAPRHRVPVDPSDRFTDLTVEHVPRSAVPPKPEDLDNDVLRGFAIPPGYAANAHAPTRVVLPVGTEHYVTDIVFDPKP